MNELAGTGVDVRRVDGASSGAHRCARPDPARRVRRGAGASGDAGFSADGTSADGVVSADELDPLVERVLAGNQAEVEAYRGGKTGLLGFFVGQVMQETEEGRCTNRERVAPGAPGSVIEEANDVLVTLGYSEAQLCVRAAPLPGKALLKGNKILSPFSDREETVLWVVENCVPAISDFGRRQLTPHELRDCLEGRTL